MSHRLDAEASAGLFFRDELRHVLPQALEKVYAEIPYSRLVPISNEIPEGAETYKYDMYDRTGEFNLIADYGDDLPTSDVRRGEVINSIRPFGGSFKYTVDELRKAQFAKQSIEQRRADAVKQAYEERANRVCLFGQAGTGLKGFFNHPTVDRIVSTGNANDGWFDGSAITPIQMRTILQQGVDYMVSTTRMVERPDTILLPYLVHQKLVTTINEPGTDTTVLEFFLKTNPFIRNVEAINELTPANSFGALSAERIVFYKRDPGKLKFHIPMPLKFHNPQQRNLVWTVPAEAKFGGVQLSYPKSILYVDKG